MFFIKDLRNKYGNILMDFAHYHFDNIICNVLEMVYYYWNNCSNNFYN